MQPVDAINMLNNIVTPANGATLPAHCWHSSSTMVARLEEENKPPSPAQKHKECTVTLGNFIKARPIAAKLQPMSCSERPERAACHKYLRRGVKPL